MMCKSPDVPLQDELLPWTSQLRTSQPSILAIQVCHLSHLLQMINTAAHLVRAHLDFCTSWGQTRWFFAVLKAWLMSPLHCVINWEVFFTLIFAYKALHMEKRLTISILLVQVNKEIVEWRTCVLNGERWHHCKAKQQHIVHDDLFVTLFPCMSVCVAVCVAEVTSHDSDVNSFSWVTSHADTQ